MKIRLSGDTMLLVEWEQSIDPTINQDVIALAERLQARLQHVVRDIVPAYCTLGIHFDPLSTDLAALERLVQEEASRLRDAGVETTRPPIEIEVQYRGRGGTGSRGGGRMGWVQHRKRHQTTRRADVSRLHARVRAGLLVYGPCGPQHCGAETTSAAGAGARRIGRHCRGANWHLSHRLARRVAIDWTHGRGHV